MWKFLIRINKNLVTAIPVMMAAGFFFGIRVEAGSVMQLKSLIVPFTFLMVYPMMVTLNIKHLKEGIKNVKLQAVTQVINFCVIPFLAYGLGRYFFADQPYMALGLLLASLLPTSGMTISWTGFAKGNLGAAINMTVIGLTLGSLATPFYVQFLMGAKVDVNIYLVVKPTSGMTISWTGFAKGNLGAAINMTVIGLTLGSLATPFYVQFLMGAKVDVNIYLVVKQIVIIVFIPMLLGYLTRQSLLKKYGMPKFKQELAPRFPALSTIGVLGIVFVAIALKSKQIYGNPAIIGSIFVPLLIIYMFNFLLSTLVGKFFFKRGDGIALVYGTVMRNLSIALAIAINAFGAQGTNAALVIAVSYIIQVQSAAWYVKFTDKIFGPPPQEA